MFRGNPSSDIDETTKAAEVFAIGIGECGSNIVGSYLQTSRDNKLPSRVRGYLLINTDRADLTKVRQKYKIPKEYDFRAELPKSAAGKILKREL